MICFTLTVDLVLILPTGPFDSGCGRQRPKRFGFLSMIPPTEPSPRSYPMTEKDRGVWETEAGDYGWVNHQYYLYEVTVFSRAEGQIVTNIVTDPYSLGLAADSVKSLVVDLDSPVTKPFFWNAIPKPPLAAPTDIALYELHIRDFSISDTGVPEKDRGKYTAFTKLFSPGMRHLRSLAKAGLTHVHLLPSFDIASVPELASEQKTPGIVVPISAPDSQQPQAAIAAVKDQDGFNWGYDPYHYGTPEGSYSTDPNGITRIREFREMVKSLHSIGLRVVMDVVYITPQPLGRTQTQFSIKWFLDIITASMTMAMST